MPSYSAPISHFETILFDILKIDRLTEIPAFSALDRDMVQDFLRASAKICETVAQPLNHIGDTHATQFTEGSVITPPGFREAYRKFAEGGWIGLAQAEEHGGQGLPSILSESFYEMLCSANMAFSGFIELSEAVMAAIVSHGTPELQKTYLPPLISGRWTGAMHLTEAHAGSDLGLVRTRAQSQADGSYLINGQKIFITNAEHDLAENIVNLVLARLPGAPAGTRGLSLFLVPKFIPDAQGRPGRRNGVNCIALEHKMGLKAAPTGTYVFEDATGWLIGEEGGGISAMFAMVNDARLGVALQGLAIGELAMQNAAIYAQERLQGRSVGLSQAAPPEPILNHPDIRRMILTMQAFLIPARALGLWVALQIDLSRHHPDAEAARAADRLAALLTPVIKSVFTDWGFKCADLCIQVHGGHGFVRDTGVEQFLRDVRVTRIYEGTNAIQALDLVRRKIRQEDSLRSHFDGIRAAIAKASDLDAQTAAWAGLLDAKLTLLEEVTRDFNGREFSNDIAAGANEYQDLFGLISLGWMWLEFLIATSKTPQSTSLQNVAGFFFLRILPEADLLAHKSRLGADDLMALSNEAFTASFKQG